jgi:hypothetical protein
LGQTLLNYALTSNGYSTLDDINSNHIGSNILKPNELTQSVVISSVGYQQLDLEKGGERKLDESESLFINLSASDYASKRGITVEQARNELTIAALYYNDKNKQSKYDNTLLTNEEREQKIADIMNDYAAGNINSFEAQSEIYALQGTLTPTQDSLVSIQPLIPQATTIDALESAYNYLIETSSSSSSVLCTDVANCVFPSQGSSFVDKYQNLYNVQPLFTSTPEQFENSNWDPNYGQTEALQDVTIDTILFALPLTRLGTVVKGGEKVEVGIGNKVTWVDENAAMSARAHNYNDAATGARSNLATQSSQAPAIERTLSDGSATIVKFDGLDGSVLIDRKLSVVTTNKAKNQALRQSQALSENGLTGRWEVPTQAEANRAIKMFNELGIKNIEIKVVP